MAWIQATGLQKEAWNLLLSNGLALPTKLQGVIDAAALKDAAEAEANRFRQQNTDLRESLDATQDALDKAGLALQEREATIAQRDAELTALGNRVALLADEVEKLKSELAARPTPPAPPAPPPPVPSDPPAQQPPATPIPDPPPTTPEEPTPPEAPTEPLPPKPTPPPIIKPPTISAALITDWRDGVGDISRGAGFYHAPQSTRTAPLTLTLDKDAVILTGPVSFPGTKTWERIQYAVGQDVWRWQRCGMNAPAQLGYGPTLDAPPRRLAAWGNKGPGLQTPQGFVSLLYGNLTYQFGFWIDPQQPQDIYARFPGDLDPNTLTVTLGKGNAFHVNGPDVTLSGGDVRCASAGVRLDAAAVRARIAGLTTRGCYAGIWVAADTPGTYGSDHLLQDCTLTDTELWRDDGLLIPWAFPKHYLVLPGLQANGKPNTYPYERVGEANETFGIFMRGGARGVTIRGGVIDGPFNGVSAYSDGFDEHAGEGTLLEGVTFRHIADDAAEPEPIAPGWTFRRCRFEDVAVLLSTGPSRYGPITLEHCEGFRIGSPPGATGERANGPVFKYSRGGNHGYLPPATVRLHNCTFWTDQPGVPGGANWGGGATANFPPSPERFDIRDSLFRTTGYCFMTPGGAAWAEDGNHFATTAAAQGLEYAGTRFTTNVGDYRRLTGQGASTNLHGSFVDAPWLDAQLEDPQGGNLRVKGGSPLEGKGAAP